MGRTFYDGSVPRLVKALQRIAESLDVRPRTNAVPYTAHGESTTQGHAVLQRVLRGRLTVVLNGGGYSFSGPTRFDKLFTGMTAPRPDYLGDGDVTGTEHIGPDDTVDGNYGRLLERAHGKGMASPNGLDPLSDPCLLSGFANRAASGVFLPKMTRAHGNGTFALSRRR